MKNFIQKSHVLGKPYDEPNQHLMACYNLIKWSRTILKLSKGLKLCSWAVAYPALSVSRGKVKETSWFLPFLPDFSWFFPIFPEFSPIFGKFSLSGVALCPPLPPQWLRHCSWGIKLKCIVLHEGLKVQNRTTHPDSPDRLRMSHIMQNRCGYCKLEYL